MNEFRRASDNRGFTCAIVLGLELCSIYLMNRRSAEIALLFLVSHSVKRNDVTGNRFEWELGENKLCNTSLPLTSLY